MTEGVSLLEGKGGTVCNAAFRSDRLVLKGVLVVESGDLSSGLPKEHPHRQRRNEKLDSAGFLSQEALAVREVGVVRLGKRQIVAVVVVEALRVERVNPVLLVVELLQGRTQTLGERAHIPPVSTVPVYGVLVCNAVARWNPTDFLIRYVESPDEILPLHRYVTQAGFSRFRVKSRFGYTSGTY